MNVHKKSSIHGQKSEMGGGGQVGAGDGPGRGKWTWENNASEYVRVGGGVGSRGTVIENTKKAKWGVRG